MRQAAVCTTCDSCCIAAWSSDRRSFISSLPTWSRHSSCIARTWSWILHSYSFCRRDSQRSIAVISHLTEFSHWDLVRWVKVWVSLPVICHCVERHQSQTFGSAAWPSSHDLIFWERSCALSGANSSTWPRSSGGRVLARVIKARTPNMLKCTNHDTCLYSKPLNKLLTIHPRHWSRRGLCIRRRYGRRVRSCQELSSHCQQPPHPVNGS